MSRPSSSPNPAAGSGGSPCCAGSSVGRASGTCCWSTPLGALRRHHQPGFTGQLLTVAGQRALVRRWAGGHGHPHENASGLLALMHAASSAELAGVTVHDIDPHARAIQLGRRPWPTPLDPLTWTAIAGCLQHRDGQRTSNPHLVVTRTTRTQQGRASTAYISHVLDGAGVNPRTCRLTRLVDLVGQRDPKVFSDALGLTDTALIRYLADGTDRLHHDTYLPR